MDVTAKTYLFGVYVKMLISNKLLCFRYQAPNVGFGWTRCENRNNISIFISIL